MSWHGLVIDEDGRPAEFRFDSHGLFGAVAATWFYNLAFGDAPDPPDWPYGPIDVEYEAALSRLRSSMFSIDRAGLKMHECLTVLADEDRQLRDGMHMDEAAPWLNSSEDVHLYADLILHYLYDHANALAVVLSRFFPPDDPRPSAKSFHRHRTSVAGGAAPDGTYGSILKEHTSWFDTLAAESSAPTPGLRTRLVHDFTTLSAHRPPWEARADAIRTMVRGLCDMYDQLLAWLRARLEPLAVEGTQLAVIVEASPPFMTYSGTPTEPTLFCHFLWPQVARNGP